MHINPYLTFDGNCEEPFGHYATILGGQIDAIMRFEGTPACELVPEDWHGKVMHAQLTVGDHVLMGSDPPPQMREAPKGIAVSLQIDDPAEAERVFAALAEDGTVTMPIQETFWAYRFGMVTDRFGTPWMINCERGDG